MKINNITIKGFGKLQNTMLNFSKRINVIYGKNEAGKSTAHNFIKSMFFGIKNKKSRSSLTQKEKFEPWDNKQAYEGSLKFSYQEKEYIIYRSFGNDINIFEIYDADTNEKIEQPEIFLSKVLSNLTVTSFDNTISIGQLKSPTDTGMAEELRRFISNVNTSGDISINSLAAIEYLKLQKQDFENKQIKDATVNYTKILGNIRNAERELSSDEYKIKLPEINKKISDNKNVININSSEISKLEEEIKAETTKLKENGFESKNDIDVIKAETNKIYNEYSDLRNTLKRATIIITNIFIITCGLALSILNTIFLVVTYPNIGSAFNISYIAPIFTKYFVFLNLPTNIMTTIIVILYVLAVFLLLSGIITLINNSQGNKKVDDMTYVLSEIFNHQINTNIVSEESMNQFNEHIENMYETYNNIADKKIKIKQLTKENTELITEQENLKSEIQDQQRLQFEIEQKIDKINQLREDAEKIKKDIAYNDEIQKEIDSLNLSIDLLNELSTKVKIMFGSYINKNASEYLKGITNNKYDSLNVDNALNITINSNNRIIQLEQLSTGTIDQIYLAVRLAIANIINGTNERLPLVFDDCFAMYDDERVKSTLDWLINNYNGQIIIFTCHNREEVILDQLGVDFNRIII